MTTHKQPSQPIDELITELRLLTEARGEHISAHSAPLRDGGVGELCVVPVIAAVCLLRDRRGVQAAGSDPCPPGHLSSGWCSTALGGGSR